MYIKTAYQQVYANKGLQQTVLYIDTCTLVQISFGNEAPTRRLCHSYTYKY